MDVGEIVAVLLQEGTPTQETLADLSAERAKELLLALLNLNKKMAVMVKMLTERLADGDDDGVENNKAPLSTEIDSVTFRRAGKAAGCPGYMITRVMVALRRGHYHIPNGDKCSFITIADILRCPYSFWSSICGFGRGSMGTLEKIMHELGYAEFKINV